MYVALKETGSCETVAALPPHTFLADTIPTALGGLCVHLCAPAPDADKPKKLHCGDLPDPLCYGMLWGAVYFGLADGTPLDRDAFVRALASAEPHCHGAVPPVDAFGEEDDPCELLPDEPEPEPSLCAMAEEAGLEDEGSDEGDGDEECEDDTLAACDACHGEGCVHCVEVEESEIEGE
jgi:hypothetical protein